MILHNLLLTNVDVWASTGVFVGTVCLIAVRPIAAQFRGEQDVVDVGELVGKTPRLCSSTCLAPS